MKTHTPFYFWTWFHRFSDVYLQVHKLPEEDLRFWMAELKEHLNTYSEREWHPVLEWKKDGSPAEMILTANSQANQFPVIERLIEQAPEIPGWKFHALYPPRQLDYNIEARFGKTGIEPTELWFLPIAEKKAGGKLLLQVYAEIYNPQIRACKEVIEAIIFNVLGEKSWVMDIAAVQINWLYMLDQETRNHLLKIEKLPACLEKYKNTITEKSKNGVMITLQENKPAKWA